MFNITWDKETGGVKLSTQVTKETLGISPRPVFYEELDMLCMAGKYGWKYPHCQEPLLWAVNKQYWYRGELVFDVKGANIYDPATVNLREGKEGLELAPVDLEKMLEKNYDYMFLLESEAIEFIYDTYRQYAAAAKSVEREKANQIDYEELRKRAEKKTGVKMAIVKEDCDSFDIMPLEEADRQGKRVYQTSKVDKFIASFSGGKDSQVVLDLCTKAIPPTDFEVIYSDTGYELPPSLEIWEQTKSHYQEKFPKLRFTLARNHGQVQDYWDKIGTPSDTHRWCCTVMKTAPLYRTLKIEGTNRQAKVLAYEGVRAEESATRSSYHRLGRGVKHSFVINARPILHWSTTEIFFYLFANKLPINEAYKLGKSRVGCILCPFGSPWDDMIVNREYPQKLKPFLDRIDRIIAERKIPNAKEYVADRLWRMRGSGKYSKEESTISISSNQTAWEAKVIHPKLSILKWMPAIGKYTIDINKKGLTGQIGLGNSVYEFELKNTIEENGFDLKLHDDNNLLLRYLFRRLINKTTFCINCESCEIECPTGALQVVPEVTIDTTKCTNCHKCLDFHNTGCIVADSLSVTENKNSNNTKMSISAYGTFGIKQEWLEQYLDDTKGYWENCSLGIKQIPSFRAWLKDAEILDEKNNLSRLGELCAKISQKKQNLLWEIIYINLAHKSSLFEWFIKQFTHEKEISRTDINKAANDYFQSKYKTTTIEYAVQALMQVFKYSPIGSVFGVLVAQDTKRTKFVRQPYPGISLTGLAYSLYKYAEGNGITTFRVSDLYREEEESGPYREFGIGQEEMKKKLRALSSQDNRVLIAELGQGLDHITLRDDLTPLRVLEQMTEKD